MIHWFVYSGLVLLSLAMFLFSLKQRKQNIAIMANTIKLLMIQEEEFKKNKTNKEQSNEDFLKFVSDSRDWAYQYIEDVQKVIDKFIKDIEPEIDYFDEYSVAYPIHPHYYSMKSISEGFKELKKTLPEGQDDKA